MENQKYGTLLTPDIKIHRQYFRECVKLLGIRVLYRAPKENKRYTTYAELDANYDEPLLIGCLFDEHPAQQSLRKMGWVSELQDNSSFITVDYDLPGLQQGALFIVPSGLDDGRGRLFRVVKLVNSLVYPATITCEIVPEYIDNFESVARGKDIDELIEDEKLNILEDENIGPMSSQIELDEFALKLNTE